MKATFRHLAWMWVLLCCSASAQTGAGTYTVKPGDSLSKIARSQGCTVDALAKANGIKLSALIQPGQTLKLPGAKSATSRPAATAATGSHTIQPGDTFSSISRQYGIPVATLIAANPETNPKSLKPGQKILLASTAKIEPPRQATPPAPVPEASAPANPAAAASPPETVPAAAAEDSGPVAAKNAGAGGQIRTVVVETETTFGEFAAQHGATIERLNELNGLDLTAATVLAKGSELYVPGQP